jgi:uncharacterized protein YkwD
VFRKRTFLVLVLFLGIFVLSQGIASLHEENFTRDPDAEIQVLTELNRWRIHRGLGPLMRNSDLDALAMQQATYKAPLVPFTGEIDFHKDSWGDGVFKRAEFYGWPSYDNEPNKVLVSEIAAYYPSVSGAISFWQHSTPHRKSVTTPGYREAGVAVLRKGNWLLSYVVLGGREDVLPVMYDPVRNLLYLSTDKSWFAHPFRPLYVKILDDQGNRLHSEEWLVWRDRIPLPPNATDNITVVVSDGIQEITTQTNLYDARIYPADPLPTPKPAPTARPSLNLVRSPVTPAPTQEPAVPSVTIDGSFDVKMVYGDTSFSLINQSSRALDLSRLIIVSNTLNFKRTADWLGKYSKVALTDFPTHWCMQVWSYEVFTGPPGLPTGCSTLASGRSLLSAGDRFWLSSRFDVYYGLTLVATCRRGQKECGFDVPQE